MSQANVDIGTLLAIIFTVLKLTGNIDWSWWWVLSPLWIPLAIALGIGIIAVIVQIMMGIIK